MRIQGVRMYVNGAAIYEIRVKGVLDSRWSEWFDGMTLSNDDISGETTLCGAVSDRAALHGLCSRRCTTCAYHCCRYTAETQNTPEAIRRRLSAVRVERRDAHE